MPSDRSSTASTYPVANRKTISLAYTMAQNIRTPLACALDSRRSAVRSPRGGPITSWPRCVRWLRAQAARPAAAAGARIVEPLQHVQNDADDRRNGNAAGDCRDPRSRKNQRHEPRHSTDKRNAQQAIIMGHTPPLKQMAPGGRSDVNMGHWGFGEADRRATRPLNDSRVSKAANSTPKRRW